MSDMKFPYCISPWVNMYIAPTGVTYPCCLNHRPMGTLKENLLESWNSENFKTLRRQMLNGEAPPSCQSCTAKERIGASPSMRQRLNTRFVDQLSFVKKTSPEGAVPNLNIRYMDFRWSNLCNFKCRFCSVELSSSWLHDTLALGGNDQYTLHEKSIGFERILNKRTVVLKPEIPWQIISDTILPQAEEINLLGGEPLIMDETLQILETLLHLGREKDVSITLVTNGSHLTLKGKKILDLLVQFKKVNLSISVDGIGAPLEYMRKGSKWDQTYDNLKEIERIFLKSRSEDQRFFPQIFFSVYLLNAYHLVEAIGFLKRSFKLPLKINLSTSPDMSRLDALPLEFKKSLNQVYSESDLEEVKEVAHFLNQPFTSEERAASLFREYFFFNRDLDLLRSENFWHTFPKWAEAIKASQAFGHLLTNYYY